jgi:hypothetical protein
MPRIHPQLRECVFFLFRRNPKTGQIDGPRGTGFFVSRYAQSPDDTPLRGGLLHLYAVSNWHLAIEDGASIIRVNTDRNETRFLEYEPTDWIFDREADLAVVDVHNDLRPNDAISHINEHNFFAGDLWSRAGLTIGEDTFMLGLFTEHHGGDWNTPCACFGNISMLASLHAKVRLPTGFEQACHLVDAHSRGGFSGSPVFVYRTSGSDLTKMDERNPFGVPEPTNVLFGLLGIHCGQFWEHIEFRKSEIKHEGYGVPIVEGDRLRVPSSMTIVMPAWSISSLIDSEPFDMTRKKREVAWAMDPKNRATVRFERAGNNESLPPASDENPNHREDFNRPGAAQMREREV